MRGIWYICLFFHCFSSTAQVIYWQDNYKGGISVDGKSYYSMTYQQKDTILFQNSVPPGATVRKAFLISFRGNSFVVGWPPLPDTGFIVNYNGNLVRLDSSDKATRTFGCSNQNPSEKVNMVVEDVTTFTQPVNNKLILPCQCPLQGGEAIYNGFLLAILYDDPIMPTCNAVIVLNDQTYFTSMTYNITGLNPVNTVNDVGLSVWVNDVGSLIPDKFWINSNYLGAIYSPAGNVSNTKVPGSFYYQNNTLYGLNDDTPDSFFDSTDALANIKTYLTTNTTSLTLTSTLSNVSGGCIDEVNAFILAYQSPCPINTNKPIQTFTLCSGESIQIPSLAGTGNTFNWYPGSGLSDSLISTPIASPSVTTNYIVQVDSAGCKHTEHVKVGVYPTPRFNSVQVTNAICGDIRGQALITQPQGGAPPYSYDIGGNAQSSPTFSSLNPGTYLATISDSRGCAYNGNFSIAEINPAITNFLISNDTVCIDKLVLFMDSSQSVNNMNWFCNDTLFSTDLTSASYTFTHFSTYTITLIGWHNQPQCSDTLTRTLFVKDCPSDSLSIVVPNIFTPNQDGINDTWQPIIHQYGYTFSDFQVMIYDRWGVKVYELSISNTQSGWDGHNTAGNACSEGTYFYVIAIKANSFSGNRSETKKGFLQLLR